MPKKANEGKSGTQTILQRCQRSKDAREAIDIESNIEYEYIYIGFKSFIAQTLDEALLAQWETQDLKTLWENWK